MQNWILREIDEKSLQYFCSLGVAKLLQPLGSKSIAELFFPSIWRKNWKSYRNFFISSYLVDYIAILFSVKYCICNTLSLLHIFIAQYFNTFSILQLFLYNILKINSENFWWIWLKFNIITSLDSTFLQKYIKQFAKYL